MEKEEERIELPDILDNLEAIGEWFHELEAIFDQIKVGWKSCRQALNTFGEDDLAAGMDQLIQEYDIKFRDQFENEDDSSDI